MQISKLTHDHLLLDRAIANLTQVTAALGERLDDPAQRGPLREELANVRRLLEVHTTHEESELLPAVVDLMGSLPEIAQIIEQHEELKRTLTDLDDLCADPESTAFLLSATVDDFVVRFDKHSIIEADFLDTVASTVSPSSTTDG